MKQADMFQKHSVYTCRTSAGVLDDLFSLHFPNIHTVLDVTYGLGAFWRGWRREIPFQVFATDIDQEKTDRAIINAVSEPAIVPLAPLDARDLSLIDDNSFDVGVLDPPFLAAYTNKSAEVNLDDKYGTLETQRDILALYRDGIRELARVCTKGMIVKLKDGISNHVLWPIRWAVIGYGSEATGRFPEDIAVFAPCANVLVGGTWQNQQHLRRVESYFILWKFGKGAKWGSVPE